MLNAGAAQAILGADTSTFDAAMKRASGELGAVGAATEDLSYRGTRGFMRLGMEFGTLAKEIESGGGNIVATLSQMAFHTGLWQVAIGAAALSSLPAIIALGEKLGGVGVTTTSTGEKLDNLAKSAITDAAGFENLVKGMEKAAATAPQVSAAAALAAKAEDVHAEAVAAVAASYDDSGQALLEYRAKVGDVAQEIVKTTAAEKGWNQAVLDAASASKLLGVEEDKIDTAFGEAELQTNAASRALAASNEQTKLYTLALIANNSAIAEHSALIALAGTADYEALVKASALLKDQNDQLIENMTEAGRSYAMQKELGDAAYLTAAGANKVLGDYNASLKSGEALIVGEIAREQEWSDLLNHKKLTNAELLAQQANSIQAYDDEGRAAEKTYGIITQTAALAAVTQMEEQLASMRDQGISAADIMASRFPAAFAAAADAAKAKGADIGMTAQSLENDFKYGVVSGLTMDMTALGDLGHTGGKTLGDLADQAKKSGTSFSKSLSDGFAEARFAWNKLCVEIEGNIPKVEIPVTWNIPDLQTLIRKIIAGEYPNTGGAV